MNKTLLLIKPDATSRNIIGDILKTIEKNGFTIEKIRMEKLTKIKAKKFYNVHRKKDFYKGLVDYMTSGKTVGVLLKKTNAVNDLRDLVGDTDPAAKKNSIRAKYGVTLRKNSVHASDSAKSAKYEIRIFFGDKK